MGLLAWWQQKRALRFLGKLTKKYFAYWWEQYKDKDCPQRDALRHYLMAEERHVKLSDFLWQQGYRHGDHVLVFDRDGAFRHQVLTKFYEYTSLMPADMYEKFEEAQGTQVRPEDRTKVKSQPDFSAHETGMLIPQRLPRWFTRLPFNPC